MKEKLTFIELMFKDLVENVRDHMDFEADYKKDWNKYHNGELGRYPHNTNFMNKNHGKVALKRKITYLRQELLDLERMLDE